MNIVFLHPNFPAQFLHLAQYFAKSGRHKVVYLTRETKGSHLQGVTVVLYKLARQGTKEIHPYIKLMEEAVL